MKRRSFIKAAGTLTVALSTDVSAFANISFPASDYKIVLRNGRSFYENKWQLLDIGIDGAGKLKIGPVNSLQGEQIIDASNKIVSPGFIDILSDNSASPQRTYKIVEKFKIADGVTTALQMHGGNATTSVYYEAFGKLPHYINYGVSTAVMHIRYGVQSLTDRKKKVEKCLEEGALGVSHSIEYQPTPYEETLEYARLAKKYDRTFFLHLRYSSSEQELEGVDEAIRIAKNSGARVHIDHLHSTGGTYHMKEALDKIQLANSQGLSITCCVYPYTFWATYLHSKRFDEGWQKRYGLTYNDLRLVGTGERLTKESFAKYRALKRLAAVPEGTLPLENTVDLALRKDFCMIGSDGGIEYEPNANSHPRGAGCFSTAIRHGLDIGMPLEKILEKVTTLPRSLILPAMNERGVLKEGTFADITIFDEKKIKAKATVENPNQFSEGIELVIVGGVITYKDGKLIGSNGVGIRYQKV
ncbi:MAG: amidohydrolase family protein [Cyclobacteriaceae bacterium]|nr:amidohydrolase family protein [Cyclobacteriaceae bacterium]